MSDQQDPTPASNILQGAIPPLGTDQQRRDAMDQAFEYRGDVTIQTFDGRTIEGYVFDRQSEGKDPSVRVIDKTTSQRLSIKYADITHLTFTGRDTAAGKSWEAWVK